MVTNIDNYNNYNLFGYNELSSIYAPSRSYLWGIVTGSYITGNDVTGSDRKLHHRKSWTGTGNEREIFFLAFSPYFPRFFLTGTSLDYMYGQWNCESNMYRVTIVILPPIAMLNHFLNQWFIMALTGTPVSIDNEVFQTE
jgi:hypothetical protein